MRKASTINQKSTPAICLRQLSSIRLRYISSRVFIYILYVDKSLSTDGLLLAAVQAGRGVHDLSQAAAEPAPEDLRLLRA